MKSPFVRNVARLFSANLAAQAISIAALPFITRAYSPNEYGIFAGLLVISSIFGTITCLSLPSGIVRNTSSAKANHLFSLCVYVVLISHIAFILVSLFALSLFSFDYTYLLILATGSAATAMLTAFQAIANFRTDYRVISFQAIIRSIAYVCTAVLAPALGAPATGQTLFFAHLLSYAISLVFIWHSLKLLHTAFSLKPKFIITVLRRERDIVSFLLPATWIDVVSERSVALQLQFSSAAFALGNFHLSQRTLSMPATLLATSVSRVFTPELARRTKTGQMEAYKLVVKTWLSLAAIGLIPLFVLISSAPQIFTIAFGSNWSIAGEMAQVMAVGYFAKFVSTPTSSIFLVSRTLSRSLYLSIFTAAIRVLGTVIGFAQNGAYGAVVGYTAADVSAIVLYNYIGLKGLRSR